MASIRVTLKDGSLILTSLKLRVSGGGSFIKIQSNDNILGIIHLSDIAAIEPSKSVLEPAVYVKWAPSGKIVKQHPSKAKKENHNEKENSRG